MGDYRDSLDGPTDEYNDFYPSLTPPTLVEAEVTSSGIEPNVDRDRLAQRLRGGEVFVLKDVFDPQRLRSARTVLLEWAQETAEVTGDRTETTGSVHRRWQNESAPLLHRHFHLVLEEDSCEEAVLETLQPICEPLLSLQNDLAGTNLVFDPDAESSVNPSVFQYPRGGGHSPMHTHPYRPQRIGVILGLAEQGVDYDRGGTRFGVGSGCHGIVDTQNWHDIGDITLFRTDLPHAVTPVDPTENLDWSADDGRWTLVLPFFHGE